MISDPYFGEASFQIGFGHRNAAFKLLTEELCRGVDLSGRHVLERSLTIALHIGHLKQMAFLDGVVETGLGLISLGQILLQRFELLLALDAADFRSLRAQVVDDLLDLFWRLDLTLESIEDEHCLMGRLRSLSSSACCIVVAISATFAGRQGPGSITLPATDQSCQENRRGLTTRCTLFRGVGFPQTSSLLVERGRNDRRHGDFNPLVFGFLDTGLCIVMIEALFPGIGWVSVSDTPINEF